MYIDYKQAWESEGAYAPDMLVTDLDGTLTHVGSITAKIASVSDRMELGLSDAFVWAYNTVLSTCKSLGVNQNRFHNIKDSLAHFMTSEQEDSFFVLSAAAYKNIPCVLVSNGPGKWGNYVLKQLDLKYFFEKAVFREDMPGLKPDPRCLITAMTSAPTVKDRLPVVWVYGDRVSDMLLATNANKLLPYQFVPVTVRGTRAAEAMDHHPDLLECPVRYVFESQFAMACSLRPELGDNIKKYAHDRSNVTATIDSPRLP